MYTFDDVVVFIQEKLSASVIEQTSGWKVKMAVKSQLQELTPDLKFVQLVVGHIKIDISLDLDDAEVNRLASAISNGIYDVYQLYKRERIYTPENIIALASTIELEI